MWKGCIGFAAEYGIEWPIEMFGVERGQRPACHQQAVRQIRPQRFSDPKGIAAQGDHAIDPDDIRPVRQHRFMNLFKCTECAIEDLRLHPQLVQLAG
jgi:hypothetical protein